MVSEIISIVLPVCVMILLGFICKKFSIISQEGISGLKSVVGDICLPVVLFNAFLNAEYDLRIVITCLAVYIGYIIALGCGVALRKVFGIYGKYIPLLVTAAEGGMLGYSLYALLVGSANLKNFATVDLGQTLFAFTFFLTFLKSINGTKQTPKDVLKTMFSNKPFLGILLGIILGAAGVQNMIDGTSFGNIFATLISFVTAPCSALVLIIVGYGLSLDKRMIRPVFCAVALRIAILAVLYFIIVSVLSLFIAVDTNMRLALLLLYSLPAPFIIPLYMEHDENQEKFVSANISLQTILTVAIFVVMAVFTRI